MTWTVEIDDGALKDLAKLDKAVARRIFAFLRGRLATFDNPRGAGAALKGSGSLPLWRYRVGDWRVVANIDDDARRVLVLRVAHRRDVYRRR